MFDCDCNEMPGGTSYAPSVPILQANMFVSRAPCGPRVQLLQGLSLRSPLCVRTQERYVLYDPKIT